MKKKKIEGEIPDVGEFENFLKVFGFKRTDGSIYGLLVLSPDPLSSEQIGKSLGLSQGAVSQGLKNLALWGAITSRYSSQERAQLHTATTDSLSIVATIFQKREQGAVQSFRRANELARDRFLSEGADPQSPRIQRLNSNITTCEFAEVIMEFVLRLSQSGLMHSQYSKLIHALPKTLSLLSEGTKSLMNFRKQIVSRISERML